MDRHAARRFNQDVPRQLLEEMLQIGCSELRPCDELMRELHRKDPVRQRGRDIRDVAVTNDIVEKSGAWFAYEGEKLGQGKENSRQFLMENPKILDKIEKQLRTHLGI